MAWYHNNLFIVMQHWNVMKRTRAMTSHPFALCRHGVKLSLCFYVDNKRQTGRHEYSFLSESVVFGQYGEVLYTCMSHRRPICPRTYTRRLWLTDWNIRSMFMCDCPSAWLYESALFRSQIWSNQTLEGRSPVCYHVTLFSVMTYTF